MTSTIGIPIKLLNEATVRGLIKSSRQLLYTNVSRLGPCNYSRNYIWSGLPWQTIRRCARPSPKLRHKSNILHTAEDNMNVQLKDITVTARDGRVSHLDQVYIRGSHVRFFIVPDMLRYALRARDIRYWQEW